MGPSAACRDVAKRSLHINADAIHETYRQALDQLRAEYTKKPNNLAKLIDSIIDAVQNNENRKTVLALHQLKSSVNGLMEVTLEKAESEYSLIMETFSLRRQIAELKEQVSTKAAH